MNAYERQRLLIDRILDHLADPAVEVSVIVDEGLRLAALRRDYGNLWWLRVETIGIADKREMASLDTEMAAVLEPSIWKAMREKTLLDYMERRRIAGDKSEDLVSAESVREVETALAGLVDLVESSRPAPGLHPQDLYFAVESHQKLKLKTQAGIHGRRLILGRIRTRLARFVSETESAIEFGQAATGAFERVRDVVDGMLLQIAPEALAKFKSANERAAEGDPEAGSQALVSCRRILVSLADSLYPATNAVVKGGDGVERVMSEERYRNRLWQFISDNVPHDSARRLTQASLNETGGRLDILNDLASKGVHADVTAAEVDQCVVQTYLLAGDLLRLRPAGPVTGGQPSDVDRPLTARKRALSRRAQAPQ
jgi:hypothetical protein